MKFDSETLNMSPKNTVQGGIDFGLSKKGCPRAEICVLLTNDALMTPQPVTRVPSGGAPGNSGSGNPGSRRRGARRAHERIARGWLPLELGGRAVAEQSVLTEVIF